MLHFLNVTDQHNPTPYIHTAPPLLSSLPLTAPLLSSPLPSSPLLSSQSLSLYQFSSITSPAPLTAARSTVFLSFPLPLILTLIEVTMLTTVLPLCGCLLLNTNNNNNNIIQREWSCGGGCC